MKVFFVLIIFGISNLYSQVYVSDCTTDERLAFRVFHDAIGRKYVSDSLGGLILPSSADLLKLVTAGYDTLFIRTDRVDMRYCLNALPISLDEVTVKSVRFDRLQVCGFLKQRKKLLPFTIKQWMGKESRSGAATYIEVGVDSYSLAKLFFGIVYEPEIKELDVRIFDFDPKSEKVGQQLYDGKLKAVYNKKLRVYETDVSEFRIQGRSTGFLIVLDNLSNTKELQLQKSILKGNHSSFAVFNNIKDAYWKLLRMHENYEINFIIAAEVKIFK